MVIHMNDSQLTTLEQIQAFLAGTAAVVFTPPPDDAARYRFIVSALRAGLDCSDRDLSKVSGISAVRLPVAVAVN